MCVRAQNTEWLMEQEFVLQSLLLLESPFIPDCQSVFIQRKRTKNKPQKEKKSSREGLPPQKIKEQAFFFLGKKNPPVYFSFVFRDNEKVRHVYH